MNKRTLVSMIITILLFFAAVVLIAVGIHTAMNPVTYHYGHAPFYYSVRYISTDMVKGGEIMFSLGRALLISSFVMLGFTLYFSASGHSEKRAEEKTQKKRDDGHIEDATIKEERKADETESSQNQ